MNHHNRLLLKACQSIAASILTITASGISAADWRQGFGQGIFVFSSAKSDLQLMISCPTANSGLEATSTVTLTRISTGNAISPFTMTVNSLAYDGPIEATSRMASENFRGFMQDVRKGDVKVKHALGTVVFSKANASSAIPPLGRDFQCQTGF